MLWVPGTKDTVKQYLFVEILFISGYAIYFFFSTPGTWREVLTAGITPVIKPRAEALSEEAKKVLDITKEFSDVEQNLIEKTDNTFHQIDEEKQEYYSDKEVSIEEKVALTLEVE